MKLKQTSLIACLASSLLIAGSLFAAQPQEKPTPDAASAPVKESPIGMEKARAIALEKVPGEVISEELKRDQDKLVYSFDILIKGKKGAQGVMVGATSGEVLSVKYKSPAALKREARERTRKS